MSCIKYLLSTQTPHRITVCIKRTDFFDKHIRKHFLKLNNCDSSKICTNIENFKSGLGAFFQMFDCLIMNCNKSEAESIIVNLHQNPTIPKLPILVFVESDKHNKRIKALHNTYPDTDIIEEDKPTLKILPDFIQAVFPDIPIKFKHSLKNYYEILLGPDFDKAYGLVNNFIERAMNLDGTINKKCANHIIDKYFSGIQAPQKIYTQLKSFLEHKNYDTIDNVISCLDYLADQYHYLRLVTAFKQAVDRIITQENCRIRKSLNKDTLTVLGVRTMQISPEISNEDLLLEVHNILIWLLEIQPKTKG